MTKRVLLATEKALYASAVAQAQSIIESEVFTFAKHDWLKQVGGRYLARAQFGSRMLIEASRQALLGQGSVRRQNVG